METTDSSQQQGSGSEKDPQFESELKTIFDKQEERDKHLMAFLKDSDDLISTVLKGHLIIEELIYSAVEAHCSFPQQLQEARLRFPQLVAILRALQRLPMPSHYWNALESLNKLRNSLAHNLEPQNIENRIKVFVTQTMHDSSHNLPEPQETVKSLRAAIYYLMGGFSAIAKTEKSLERLIWLQAIKEK